MKYWIDSSNHAAVTGDTDQLKKLSDPDCGGCNSYIEFYESTYSKGGYFKGGDRTIGNVDLEVEGDEVYIRGSLKAAPGSYRTTKSAPERDSKAEVTRVEFAVKFGDSRWRMIQLGLGQKG